MSDNGRPYDLLLLDFGGVCLLNPVELHDRAERALDLPPGTFTWMGPLDPSTDPLWQRMIDGDGLTERDYWAQRATEVGDAGGRELSVRDYMIMLYEPPDDSMVRAGCTDVVERAFASGMSVSVLSNDLRAFHGPEWEAGIPLLQRVDEIVDCSEIGVLKPDPRAYERAIEVTGFAPGRTLFVDDQPRNVAGAEAAGMDAVWFDIADAEGAWADVARRIGVDG